MEIQTSKVYIQVDSSNRIIRCEGGYTTPSDLTGWILIDEGIGDKYNLCQSHYFEGGLYTLDGIPRYKYVENDNVKTELRTDAEIETDREAIPTSAPSESEQLRADVDFLSAIAGVEL